MLHVYNIDIQWRTSISRNSLQRHTKLFLGILHSVGHTYIYRNKVVNTSLLQITCTAVIQTHNMQSLSQWNLFDSNSHGFRGMTNRGRIHGLFFYGILVCLLKPHYPHEIKSVRLEYRVQLKSFHCIFTGLQQKHRVYYNRLVHGLFSVIMRCKCSNWRKNQSPKGIQPVVMFCLYSKSLLETPPNYYWGLCASSRAIEGLHWHTLSKKL